MAYSEVMCSTPNAPEISVVRSLAGISDLRQLWQSLQWHPYTDLDYYLTELAAEGSAVCPHVMLLSDGGTPKTLVIGKVLNDGLKIQVGYKTVSQPSLRTLVIHARGVLGDTSFLMSKAIIDRLVRHLAGGEFQAVKLMGLPVTSPLCQWALSRPSVGMRDRFPAIAPRWQLALFDTYEQFLKAHPSLRRNSKRYHNRMVNKFGRSISFRTFSNRCDLDLLMNDLETVAARSWQRGMGAGFFNNAKTRKMFDFTLANGWCRAHLLYINGKPVAFDYGNRYGRLYVDEATAFDPAYGDLRVGTYTLLKVIEEMHRDKEIDLIDFGPGNAQDKERYCNQSRDEADVLIFAPTPRCMAINLVRSTVALAHQQLKRLLVRGGYEGAIKRSWRSRAARTLRQA